MKLESISKSTLQNLSTRAENLTQRPRYIRQRKQTMYKLTCEHFFTLMLVLGLLAPLSSSMAETSRISSHSVGSNSSFALELGERVIVVLKDGSEVIGELIEEDDDSISVKSVFGVTSIETSRIESVIRGPEVDRREFAKREKSANRRGSAKAFIDLGKWATQRGLTDRARDAFERALTLESENEEARIGLGWGQTSEGEWKTPSEVASLMKKGWSLDAGKLSPPLQGRSGNPPVSPPVTPPVVKNPKPPQGGTPESVLERLSPEQLERRKRELERRKNNREKFEEKKRREYEGVPWSQRSVIKSRNWIIECNSTPEVARTYQWIMEALSSTLNKFFKSKEVRSQKPLVKIYRNHEEFMLKTGMGGGVGGFYQPSSQNVTAYHGTFGLTGTTYTVLAHEGTHAFQGKKMPNMGNYPNWYIEGMAVYFGDGSKLDYKKKKLVTGLIPRDRLFHIQEKIRDNKHTPLSKLGGLPRNRFSGTHYADSWAVMHFLINGPESKKGQRFLAEYWVMGEKRRVAQRQFNQLAEKYFDSVSEMEKVWQEYVLSLKPDPAGEVENDRFSSMDFMFSIERPGEDWKYLLEDIEDRDLVLLRKGDTRNEIRVRLLSKSDETQSPQDWIDNDLLPAMRKKYDKVQQTKGELGGLAAYVLEFEDRAPAPPAEKKEEEAKEESDAGSRKIQDPPKSPDDVKKQPEKEPFKPLKHRSYILVGVSNAYELRGSFEAMEFPSLIQDLEWVADSFEKILRNRW